ncbi:MAG: hypothetical protein BWZ10_00815 [candidate division BRC1 bacterium ADurb.BinA364]|nr:MAG: hypothetical protein BWZ10_00815 [candidate division BRC1 bacterium ADurb.BinA364]
MADLARMLKAGVVDDDGFGLQAANHAIEPVALPVGLGARPVAVEPQAAYLPIPRAENFDRSVQVIEIFFERGVVARVGLPAPIERRVIEKGHDPLGAAAFDKLGDQVALGRRVWRVEVGQAARVVETESVMMPCRQRNVLHSRLPRQPRDGLRVELAGGEGILEFGVFLDGDGLAMHDPFALPQLRIHAPVQKQSEGHFLEAFDTRLRLWNCHFWRAHYVSSFQKTPRMRQIKNPKIAGDAETQTAIRRYKISNYAIISLSPFSSPHHLYSASLSPQPLTHTAQYIPPPRLGSA